MVERDGRGGVAGDDDEARLEPLDQPPEQRRDAARDLRLAALAVGKAGAVGDIDDRRVGQQRARRPEHRQPADAGIEEQERGGGVHPPSLREAQRRSNPAFGKLDCFASLAMTSGCLDAHDLLPPRWMTREMLLALALGYLLGSIPFGLILTRLAGKGDVREIGSGNIGATNVLRTGSKTLAALTLVLDCLKATAAILLAQRLFGERPAALRRDRGDARPPLSRLAEVPRRQGRRDLVRRAHRRCSGRRRSSMPPSGFSCC